MVVCIPKNYHVFRVYCINSRVRALFVSQVWLVRLTYREVMAILRNNETGAKVFHLRHQESLVSRRLLEQVTFVYSHSLYCYTTVIERHSGEPESD